MDLSHSEVDSANLESFKEAAYDEDVDVMLEKAFTKTSVAIIKDVLIHQNTIFVLEGENQIGVLSFEEDNRITGI